MAETEAINLITEEMRAFIGKESDPVTLEVERSMIRLFARAVGHTDQVFYDVDVAKAAGYRDLPCPPGYLGTPIYNPAKETGVGISGLDVPQPSRPLPSALNGGTELELRQDICAGDTLTATSHVSAFEERSGSLGPMLITTTKTVYRRDGEVVAIATGTGIRY